MSAPVSLCLRCEEPVLPEEWKVYVGHLDPAGQGRRVVMHGECNARGVIGSLAHIEKRCSCFVPGSECTDPPEMTRRQAARAALAAFRKMTPQQAWDMGAKHGEALRRASEEGNDV